MLTYERYTKSAIEIVIKRSLQTVRGMDYGFMLKLFLLALTIVVGSRLVPTVAQEGQTVGGASAVSETANSEKLIVAFRAKDWVTKHYHDPAKFTEMETVLKQLGCEMKKVDHNGHIDLQFRTTVWKSLALESDEQARQWNAWFVQTGIETLHGRKVNESVKSPGEIVQYRLAKTSSLHTGNENQANEYLTIFRALGCTVEKVQHGNHSDIRLNCPEWMEVEFPSHEVAHKWMDFLGKSGFEVKHSH